MGPRCATVPRARAARRARGRRRGLRPTRPVKLQGMRIEPPPSVPTASGPMPAATAAAAPPDEPPGVIFGFQGLRVMPVRGLSVTPFQPNSGVVVLPSSTAPCSRRRATAGASSFHGPLGSVVFELRSVGQPLVTNRYLYRCRHAVEQALRAAFQPAPFRFLRAFQRRFRIEKAKCVQDRIQLFNAFERGAGHFDGRDAFLPVQREQFGG